MLPPYVNEPLTDFNDRTNKADFEKALALTKKQCGKKYPLWINGEEITTRKWIKSINPSDHKEVVGQVAKAGLDEAKLAMKSAARAFETWKMVPVAVRARYLFKAAAIMKRRKHELSAWMVREAGKSWAEADGDTAEAIDFLEFYGREAERLFSGTHELTPYPGEQNEVYYKPLGIGVVIPPWNFPLAILAGMTTAALVSGNTVVLKPASATPVIAAKFVEIMREADIPAGVLNFCPGSGAEIGDFLVEHRDTRFISFTGSMEVGLGIHEKAFRFNRKSRWIKRIVAEMGGKDAIIVDEDCDVDAAIDGIVAAAYGFQGQKCSACSRAIIHEKHYDRVVKAVAAGAKKIKVGNPAKFGNFNGAVIDKNAYSKILEYIKIGKKENKLVCGGKKAPGNGWFIEPTVFRDVKAGDTIEQEEIFGPVLACIKVSSWDEAIKVANGTAYGLTGAVYSNRREHLEDARERFHVGNLYLNRKCTGALVDVHPFGGFNMSGTDSKAGGREYLLLFSQAKSVAERL
jgi:1-pyrroline-5-carboxylate dehydrogenase